MSAPASDAPRPDTRTLAASLAPLVMQACEGRLGEITWFKTDWQRGGAATGRATYQQPNGEIHAVVIKLPVVQREFIWTQRLQNDSDPALIIPRLYACGETIGGYDLAWVVIEFFAHGPLGVHWHQDHLPRMAEAAARLHAALATFPVDQPPRDENWNELLAEADHRVKINTPQHEQRWKTSLKTLRHRLGALLKEWDARPVNQWLHGDLHLANAMSRVHNDHGPVCLIDLGEIHAGHWVEDAVYLERQLWGRPQRMADHKPVKLLATARRKLGLPVEPEYPRWAMIRRALLAGTAPRFLKSEGHPAYLEACLERLEIALNELK